MTEVTERVIDKTGLKGGYDFTVLYQPLKRERSPDARHGQPPAVQSGVRAAAWHQAGQDTESRRDPRRPEPGTPHGQLKVPRSSGQGHDECGGPVRHHGVVRVSVIFAGCGRRILHTFATRLPAAATSGMGTYLKRATHSLLISPLMYTGVPDDEASKP